MPDNENSTQPLTLESLATHRNGAFGLQVDEMIRQCLRDCDDRPSLEEKRTLVIEVEFVPEADDGSLGISAVGISTSARVKLPPMRKLGSRLEVVHGEDESGKRVVEALMPHATQDARGQSNLFRRGGESND